MSELFKSRFELRGFSADSMRRISEALETSIKSRILRGINVNDLPASNLSKQYARSKVRQGKKPIRDWNLTGRTLNALNVTDVSDRQAAIWFTEAVAAQRAAIQNAREQAFGISPTDSLVLDAAIAAEIPDMLSAKRVA